MVILRALQNDHQKCLPDEALEVVILKALQNEHQKCFPDEALVKPELAPISYHPFTKADAVGIASFHGITKADAEELWLEYRTQQAGVETDQNWTRFLNENQESLGLVAA